MEQEKSLFDYARHHVLPDLIEMLQEYANNKPKEGAEVMLAIRHLQDARMRLGVAEAIADGKNPWRSEVSKKQDVEWVGVYGLKIHNEKRTPRLHGKTTPISGGSTASLAAPIIAGAMTGAAIGSMLGD